MAGRGEREVRVKFTGENSSIKGASGEVARIFQSMVDDIDDVRGAGEKLADAQKQVANSITREYEKIDTAVMTVKDSLGVEMVRAIEASGRSVEGQVQEWRRLGLTLDDITRDSDQLVAGMRELDSAARRSAGEVGDGFRKIANEADNSRSVMANFAGNAIQELPGVAGAMGPLNMAIGQFAEYATEGNIKLKNLLATGAGIAAVALVMNEISKQMQSIAEAKAWRKEEVDAWVDAIREGGSATDALVEKLSEAGEIVSEFGGVMEKFGGDITDDLAVAGVSVEQFARAVTGGQEEAERFAEALRAAGVEGEEYDRIMYGLGAQQANYERGVERAAVVTDVFGEAQADATRELDRGADALGGHMGATAAAALAQESLTTATEAAAAATEAAEQATRDLSSAQLAQIDTGYAAADAQDQFITAMEAARSAVDDTSTGVNEYDQAQRGAAQAALDMAAANQANAEQLAANSGAPLTAAASQKVFMDSLYMLAMSLDANSPVRAALLGHIETLGGMPAVTKTELELEATDALDRMSQVKDKGDDATTAVDELTTSLNNVPGSVTAAVTVTGVSTAISDVQALTREMNALQRAADAADRAVGRVAG